VKKNGSKKRKVSCFFLSSQLKPFLWAEVIKRPKKGKQTIGSFGKKRPARVAKKATKPA